MRLADIADRVSRRKVDQKVLLKADPGLHKLLADRGLLGKSLAQYTLPELERASRRGATGLDTDAVKTLAATRRAL